MKQFSILLSIIWILNGSITEARPPQFEGLNQVIDQAVDDTRDAIALKGEALTLSSEIGLNMTLDTADKIMDSLENIDPVEALYNVEEMMVAKNHALIESLFNAKKQFMETLSEVYHGTIENFYHTQQYLVNTKTAIAEISVQDIAQDTIDDVTDAVSDVHSSAQDLLYTTYNYTTSTIQDIGESIQDTGEAMIYAMLMAKEGLHNVTEDGVDSQQGIRYGAASIGQAMDDSLNGAQSYLADLGVFQAIDNTVRGLGHIPMTINTFLTPAAATDDEVEETDA